jgi:hypothetical protein
MGRSKTRDDKPEKSKSSWMADLMHVECVIEWGPEACARGEACAVCTPVPSEPLSASDPAACLCAVCGRLFKGSPNQKAKYSRGGDVCCSEPCILRLTTQHALAAHERRRSNGEANDWMRQSWSD